MLIVIVEAKRLGRSITFHFVPKVEPPAGQLVLIEGYVRCAFPNLFLDAQPKSRSFYPRQLICSS